jgi:hypothetical protein
MKVALPELTFLTVFNIYGPAYRALSFAIPADPGCKGSVSEFGGSQAGRSINDEVNWRLLS